MNDKIKLSFNEYSVLRCVDKAGVATLQDITDRICIYRDKVETIIYNLLSKQAIDKFESKLIGELTCTEEINTTLLQRDKSIYQITNAELDKYYFESTIYSSQITKTIKKPFLWGLRFNIVKFIRLALREMSIVIDAMIMYYKNKCRIKKLGLKKEKAKQKSWTKKILKSKNKRKIILEIKSKEFFKDKEKIIWTKVPLEEIVNKGIFIIAKKGKWAIEINSNLPNFERCEFLTLHTPFDSYYFVRTKNEQIL